MTFMKTAITRYLSCFLLLFLSFTVHAELTIHIPEGVPGAIPIAMVPFSRADNAKPSVELTDVIRNDLAVSGRFAVQPTSELIEHPDEAAKVHHALWRNLRVDYLVIGKVQMPSPDNYTVQFELVDIVKGVSVTGRTLSAKSAGLRRIGHMISDLIYEAITGHRGAFDAYLAYVTITKDRLGKATHRLAISDVDGKNEQVIYETPRDVFSLAWSPDGTRLAYVVNDRGNPELYVQNIFTKQIQKVSALSGLNNAPAWSPDGRRLALTLSKDGNAEIYIMDLDSKKLTRVTNSNSTNTEANWLPDGSGLLFTSDRGGKPQVYRVDIGDFGGIGQPKRLTFTGDYNARPIISPDGKRLAMVHEVDRAFRIAVMDMETEQVLVLTDTQLDESPSFAPNGDMIVYATIAKGRGVLVICSADGRSKTPPISPASGDVRYPAWSPLRH